MNWNGGIDMEYFLWAVGAAVVLYLLFIILPAVISALVLVAPQKTVSPEMVDYDGSYYGEFRERMISSVEKLSARRHETVHTRSSDGTNLTADLYPNGRRAVLFFHGFRADPMTNFAAQALFFHDLGFTVLLVRQRAHDGEAGRFVGMGLLEKEDVRAWCDWMRAHTETDGAILYGVSMGAASIGFAADMLPTDYVKGLVLDCGFSRPSEQMRRECVKRHLPTALFMPVVVATVKLTVGVDLRRDVAETLSRTTIPLLFLHGKEDESVPWQECATVYERCPGPKRLLLVEKAGHTVSFLKGGPTVEETLRAFINDIF